MPSAFLKSQKMLPPAVQALLSLLFASQMVASALQQHGGHKWPFSHVANLNGTWPQKQQMAAQLDRHSAAVMNAEKAESTAFFQKRAEIGRHSEEKAIDSQEEKPAAMEHPYVVFARTIYSWLVPCMVAILLMAVLGNGLIVVSAPWLSGEASHYNWLCVSLAGADAWAASLLVAGLILNSYLPVVLKIAWNGKCVAALLEIFRIAGMLTSNLHILALAGHQFMGICHPLLYKTRITTERVQSLILILWLIPIGFVGAWFVSIPGDSLFSDGCQHEFYTRLPFRMYIFVAFALILLLTVLIYAHILVYLLRQKARYRLRCNSLLYSYRRRVQSKMKLLTTTLLILSTFTLSWGVCVLYFVLVCKQGCPFIYLQSISFQTGLLLNTSVNLLVALKLVLNPLIYALRMCHIRRSVAGLFGTIMRSRSFSSQLLTLQPMSRQLSSPRPFARAEERICSPLSDPPSRAGAEAAGEGSASSRELLGNGRQMAMGNGTKRRSGKRRKSSALASLLTICGGMESAANGTKRTIGTAGGGCANLL